MIDEQIKNENNIKSYLRSIGIVFQESDEKFYLNVTILDNNCLVFTKHAKLVDFISRNNDFLLKVFNKKGVKLSSLKCVSRENNTLEVS